VSVRPASVSTFRQGGTHHEERVAREDGATHRVADDVPDVVGRVSGQRDDAHVERAEVEHRVVVEEDVEDRLGKRGREAVDGREGALDLRDARANADGHLRAELLLEVARRREVVRVRVRLAARAVRKGDG
jgi:hypothetical protein